jgi:putative hydrolase of the HAD superfamily
VDIGIVRVSKFDERENAMKKALFWDFDGTLSYPNKSFFTALKDSLKEFGYDIEKTEDFLGKTYSWKNPQIDYVEKSGNLWWDLFFEKICVFCSEKGVLQSDLNKICNRFKELLIAVENYELYDDTIDTLNKCVELGYKNYLITNNYPEIVENLEKLGIAKYFTDYVVSSHIGYEKPRSEFFDYAKKRADNPDVGYVIGDNPIADIQGGKVAGFKTIAVHECKESIADFYLQNLREIFLILT